MGVTTEFIFTSQGGADVVRLWDQIASAAAVAGKKVPEAAKESSVALEAMNFSVKEVQRTVEEFASTLGGPLGRGLQVLQGLGTTGAVAAGIIGIGGALATAGVEAAKFAQELTDQADAVGINVQRYQELIFAGKAYGVSQQELD